VNTLSDQGGRRIIFIGGGGHAGVLHEVLDLQGVTVDGYLAPERAADLVGVPWLGTDNELTSMDPAEVRLVNAIGSIRSDGRRRSIYETASAAGYEFLSVIDTSANIRASATLGTGVQILAGVIVNSGARIGVNTIVNTGAIIEHDSMIGDSVHVSPGAVLGARVLQGVSIGSQCTVGAGAVVTRDIADGVTAVGVPAVARPTTNAS
jgi:sugar O-acyltransferase (sialic acid O-acetyltransferase NeuD family)